MPSKLYQKEFARIQARQADALEQLELKFEKYADLI
jgi:hypothetical protein